VFAKKRSHASDAIARLGKELHLGEAVWHVVDYDAFVCDVRFGERVGENPSLSHEGVSAAAYNVRGWQPVGGVDRTDAWIREAFR
jgi:hypothetical protein